MIEEKDYWLIVWKDSRGTEIQQPVLFQKGLNPNEWCNLIMGDARNEYRSYECYRLILDKK